MKIQFLNASVSTPPPVQVIIDGKHAGEITRTAIGGGLMASIIVGEDLNSGMLIQGFGDTHQAALEDAIDRGVAEVHRHMSLMLEFAARFCAASAANRRFDLNSNNPESNPERAAS